MNFPKELCQLVIRNMEIIETAPEVITATEKRLFAAINARVEAAIEAKTDNWKGCYDLVTDNDDEQTVFAPGDWPDCEDGSYGAYYFLMETEECADYHWLSCATGVRGAELCFAFIVESEWSGLSPSNYKKSLETFYAGNDVLQKAGFSLASNKKSIVRPFHFDPEKIAEEYPDLEEALAPLDAALEDIFRAHAEFDKFVGQLKNRLMQTRSASTEIKDNGNS